MDLDRQYARIVTALGALIGPKNIRPETSEAQVPEDGGFSQPLSLRKEPECV